VSWEILIREDALTDIETAAAWYEGQQPGLGADFARTIRRAIGALPGNPLIHRVRDRRRNVRWFLPSRFPYRSCYRVQDNRITVFAVVHTARHDREWRKRP
jgi:toxin ParE1/3/4